MHIFLLQELGQLGYKYQFVTLAGFHSLNHGMFTLSKGYAARGMAAYSELQQKEFASEKDGYTATRCVLHQHLGLSLSFACVCHTYSATLSSREGAQVFGRVCRHHACICPAEHGDILPLPDRLVCTLFCITCVF